MNQIIQTDSSTKKRLKVFVFGPRYRIDNLLADWRSKKQQPEHLNQSAFAFYFWRWLPLIACGPVALFCLSAIPALAVVGVDKVWRSAPSAILITVFLISLISGLVLTLFLCNLIQIALYRVECRIYRRTSPSA